MLTKSKKRNLLVAFIGWMTFLVANPLFAHEPYGLGFMCHFLDMETYTKAENGNSEAQYQVGNSLDYCEPRDPEGATKYFLRAAQQGHIQSILRMGRRYLFGFGVQQSDKEAYFWLSVGKRLLRSSPSSSRQLPDIEYELSLLERDIPPHEAEQITARAKAWSASTSH